MEGGRVCVERGERERGRKREKERAMGLDWIELKYWVEGECKLRPGNVLIVWKNPKKYAGRGNLE